METNKRGRDQRSEISVVECYSRGKSNADDTVSDAVTLHSIVSYFLVIFILHFTYHIMFHTQSTSPYPTYSYGQNKSIILVLILILS